MVAGGQYDLVFSLGQACACSLTLRTANLQLASFPLDWLADGTLPSRVDLLIRRFDHWLDKEDFVYNGTNPINGLGMFRNRKTGLNHLHDFDDRPIESSHAQVVAKYARREKRLFDLIEKAKRVLLVYIDKTMPGGKPPTVEEIVKAREDMSQAFPGADFDFIHLVYDRDVPFEQRVVSHPCNGVTEIRFNYHDDKKDVNSPMAATAILSLGVSVRDYRTKAERKAYKLGQKMKKYNVNTRFGLFLAKAKERIGGIFSNRANCER